MNKEEVRLELEQNAELCQEIQTRAIDDAHYMVELSMFQQGEEAWIDDGEGGAVFCMKAQDMFNEVYPEVEEDLWKFAVMARMA